MFLGEFRDAPSVLARKHAIAYHQIKGAVDETLARLYPVSNRDGVVAFIEEEVEQVSNIVIIFDNQNARPHLPSNAHRIRMTRKIMVPGTIDFSHLHRLI